MSEHEKRKLYLDEFHNLKGMDSETYRSDYLVAKTNDLKGSSIKSELIKEHMKKKDVVLFDKENKIIGEIGTGKPFVKELLFLKLMFYCEQKEF